MPDVPRVGVAVAAYNAEAFIAETVRSILAQTFGDFELVVVDDGSTDRTAEVARAALGADPRGRVVRQDNRGEGACKNRGIRECSADLVAVVDGDDVCHPDKLARQVALLDARPEVAACFTFMQPIDTGGAAIAWDVGEAWHNQPLRGREQLLRELFAVRNVLVHPTVMLRRGVVSALGGYNEDIFAPDFDLWFRILHRHEIAVIPERLLSYRRHPQSQMHQVVGSRRVVHLAATVLRALDLYAIEDVCPALRDLPAGPARDRATAAAHLELAGLLERGALLELLPAALEQRLRARALAPGLQSRPDLELVADMRTRLLEQAIIEQYGALARHRVAAGTDADAIARAHAAEVYALHAAMDRHFRTHPVHRAGAAAARAARALTSRWPLAGLRRLRGP